MESESEPETEFSILADILIMKTRHAQTWRDKPERYWFASLVEEIMELGGALVGLHPGPAEWELKQIASICMNWLEMREARRKTEK